MTTITATPGGDAAEIELTITPTDEIIYIYRTDANGTNKVRTRPGVFPRPLTGLEVRRNRIANPSFENGATGVDTVAAVTLATGSLPNSVVAGSNVLSVAIGAGATPFTYIRQTVAMSAGQYLAFAANVRLSGGSKYYRLRITWRTATADNGQILGPPMEALNNNVGGARTSISGLAPAGTVEANVYVFFYADAAGTVAPAAGSVFHSDAWHVAIGSTEAAVTNSIATYFDGDTASTATTGFKWLGDAHASASVEIQGAPFTIDDYEPANGIVNYVVIGQTGQVRSETAVSTTFAMDTPWLSVPTMQTLSRPVASVIAYDAMRDTRSTIIDIPGRSDPVVVLRAMGTRRGQLEIFTGTHAEAAAVVSICDRGEVLMLRQPEHMSMDMYFTALSATIKVLQTKGSDSVFSVVLRYVEVRFPGGALLTEPGWSFAELAAENFSFKALSTKYRDFQAVAENKPNVGA